MKIHPYLNFPGKTEEAFRFYEKVLGGKLTEFYRFGSMPQQGGFELTPEQKNFVMHVGLALPDGQMIMASDTMEGMGPPRVEGNNISISIHPDSRAEADRVYSRRWRTAARSRCRLPISSGATILEVSGTGSESTGW